MLSDRRRLAGRRKLEEQLDRVFEGHRDETSAAREPVRPSRLNAAGGAVEISASETRIRQLASIPTDPPGSSTGKGIRLVNRKGLQTPPERTGRLAGRRKRDEHLDRVFEGHREEPSAAREPV